VKNIYVILFVALPFLGIAQPPPGYYNNATGLSGTPLRAALHLIIYNHNAQTYPLWSHFPATDATGSTKVWDIYSDIPGQTPPYLYSFFSDQCGNYNAEGACYNHEHSWPSGYFNDAMPMRSDLFHIYPTDGWVNNKRGNFAYGEVGNPTYTSQNGCKLGPNTYPGFSGTVFEPIDAYKGDLARSYFYMATRYYTEDGSWDDWAMANKAELKQWAIDMLLDWHHNDPVSQKELDRNEAVYGIQNNRNPFIDQPLYADCIWGICTTGIASTATEKPKVRIHPNPAVSEVRINWTQLSPDETVAVDIMNLTGQVIYRAAERGKNELKITVSDWPKGVYLLQVQSEKGAFREKIVVQ
jgi:endonuclease I